MFFIPLSFFKNYPLLHLYLSGFDINSLSKSITLSAPNTRVLGLFKLTLFALSSARFLEIISGDAFSLINAFLTTSSSTLEGSTSIGNIMSV